MAEYIKKEDAVSVVLRQPFFQNSMATEMRQIKGIDIVRCKECRFGKWHEQAEEYICILHDQDLFDADHFCSYGEREGE